MKKVLTICAAVALVACMGSCAKKCNCTRYEDGKKVSVTNSDNVKYFEHSACTENSVSPYQGYSIITDGKEVSVEIKCK